MDLGTLASVIFAAFLNAILRSFVPQWVKRLRRAWGGRSRDQ